jgi:MFS family permease
MLQGSPVVKNRVGFKLTAKSVFIVANAFIWYLLAFYSLKICLLTQNATEENTLLILGVNTAAIALAGFIGTIIVGKYVQYKRFLYVWLSSGILLSLIPAILNLSNLTELTIISFLFGFYFGLGMPATMGYHSSLTRTEDRARTGGLTFLIVGITFAMTSLITQSSLLLISIILAVLRILGLIAFHNLRVPEQSRVIKNNKSSYSEIITNRSFLLYFVPWLMFTLINYMTIPIQQAIYPSQSSYETLAEIENIIMAIVAVVGGFIADKIGRKRLIIIGFVLLGVGYAIIGLASLNAANVNNSATLENSLLLYVSSVMFMIIDGVAWGIFYVLFVFTLWGDIALNKNSDKFYFLGVLPYVSAYLIQITFSPFLKEISYTMVFSFASVFLFIAVLPLIYAPETLPDKVIKDRELNSYIETARKKVAK